MKNANGSTGLIHPSKIDHFKGVNVSDPDACWERPGVKPRSYQHVKIDGKIHIATRILWQVMFGPIPAGMCICHSCDNPRCVNPRHLWLGTHNDNMADRNAKGRTDDRRGDSNPKAKLTLPDVIAIRLSTERTVELARRYGVTWATVNSARIGRTWKHVGMLAREEKANGNDIHKGN